MGNKGELHLHSSLPSPFPLSVAQALSSSTEDYRGSVPLPPSVLVFECAGSDGVRLGGMDINHGERCKPGPAPEDGCGVSTVMSPWRMAWRCWRRLAHRLSFQLVPKHNYSHAGEKRTHIRITNTHHSSSPAVDQTHLYQAEGDSSFS